MSSSPIVVIGGGISGLACAYYLLKLATPVLRSRKIILLEASSRTGGWLQSHRFNDGVIHELGPRSIRTGGVAGKNTLNLIEELGMAVDLIGVPADSPAGQKRYILVNGELVAFNPTGLKNFFVPKPPLKSSFFKILWNEASGPPFKDENDISVFNFVQQRLGSEVAVFIADPLCRGIAAGDARNISFKSLFPEIYRRTLEKGSIIRGMFLGSQTPLSPALEPNETTFVKHLSKGSIISWSLKNGLQSLPEKLTDYLEKSGVVIKRLTSVDKVTFHKNEVQVHCNNGDIQDASAVFSSLPSFELAKCIQDLPTQLKERLEKVDYVDVAVACLEFDEKKNLDGFGFLVPSSETCKVLGITYDSCCFPDHDSGKNITRVTCMMGGAWYPELFGSMSKEEILTEAVKTSRSILNFKVDPVRTTLRIHRKCIPQYRLGHAELVSDFYKTMQNMHRHFYTFGTAFSGVAVNDVVFAAKKAVHDFSISCNVD